MKNFLIGVILVIIIGWGGFFLFTRSGVCKTDLTKNLGENQLVQDKEEILAVVSEKKTMGKCPVCATVLEETTLVSYAHEGKPYLFCCSQCVEVFKGEPQKYLTKLDILSSPTVSSDQTVQ